MLLPLKPGFGADLLPLAVSPLVNGSSAELWLLLPEHRGGNAGDGVDLLVVVLGVMLLMVVVVTLPMPLMMVLVIFGFRKNIISGSNDKCISLPINPLWLIREDPKNLITTATTEKVTTVTVNDGNYKMWLLLLSLNKQDRRS